MFIILLRLFTFGSFLVQEVRFVLLLTIYSTLLNVRTMNYDFLLYFLNFLNSMSYGTVHAYLPYTVIIFITVYLYPTYGLYGTVPYPLLPHPSASRGNTEPHTRDVIIL